MVRNNIRAVLHDKKMPACELVKALPDGVTGTLMSYIVNGKALPTRDVLRTMCEVMSCEPADLFNSNDVDLLSEFNGNAGRADEAAYDSEFGTWFAPDEAAALRKALTAFGYSSAGEWIREMWRKTLLQYTEHLSSDAINLSEVILSESRDE